MQRSLQMLQKLFTEAGMLRRVVTRIWNKKHAFRVGIVFEYRDQAAFEACKPLLEKHYLSAVEGLATQVFGSRGWFFTNLSQMSFKSKQHKVLTLFYSIEWAAKKSRE